MKTEEAREKILNIIKEKGKATPQEISDACKGKIPMLQIYNITKKLTDEKLVQMEQKDKDKFYSLAAKDENEPPAAGDAGETQSETLNSGKLLNNSSGGAGRNLTKYKFKGNEYNKGRLAHAVISAYAKENKPTLKQALAMWPDEIVPPYGLIKPIAEAKKMSQTYQRFFIKPEEEIKLKDCVIAVSNQMNPERIGKVIAIARKELKFSIK